MPATVTIIEDDSDTANAIADTINASGTYSVLAKFPRLQSALTALRKGPQPDIVLLDIAMPNDENAGVECLASIRAHLPAESIIVVVSIMNLPRTIFPCLRDGASGYFVKDDGVQNLPAFLDSIRAGRSWISPSVAARVAEYFSNLPSDTRDHHQLSKREHEVIELISLGFSDAEIGRTLEISPHTARTHVNRALQKLHAVNRAHGVRKYLNGET